MRSEASSRTTSPLRYGLSIMCSANDANSSACPSRRGNGIAAASESCASCGRLASSGRQEQAGRDGEHANAELRQFARDRQRHRDDAALRGRIGRLPDLAVIGGNGSGVDHHAALAGRERLELRHFGGRQPQHVEGADQVDPDHPVEIGQRHRAVAADHALGNADAGAIDQHPRRTMGFGRLRDGGFRGSCIGYVADDRRALDLGGDALGEFGVEIAHRNLRALRGQPARGRSTQSRRAAGDDCGHILQLHDFLLRNRSC